MNFSQGRNRIECNTVGFAGQCGATILAHFSVGVEEKRLEGFGIAFAKYLKKECGHLTGAKFVASAVVDSPLWQLLDNEHWSRGTIVRNINSDNRIAIFELDVRDK